MVTASVEAPGPLGMCPLGPLCLLARTRGPAHAGMNAC